jgi:hypothetical protein
MIVVENTQGEVLNATIDANSLRGSNQSAINPKLLINYLYLDT